MAFQRVQAIEKGPFARPLNVICTASRSGKWLVFHMPLSLLHEDWYLLDRSLFDLGFCGHACLDCLNDVVV